MWYFDAEQRAKAKEKQMQKGEYLPRYKKTWIDGVVSKNLIENA